MHHYQYLSRTCALEKSFRNNNPNVGFENFVKKELDNSKPEFANLASKEHLLNAVHDDSILRYLPTTDA